MANADLASWLRWLETLHPSDIELGLDRVATVARGLAGARPAERVITVGGTNGKGSVASLIERLLFASGRRVGVYTSPHLVDFRERIRVDGNPVTERSIVEALERVESVRGSMPLTFFEFTTLAAFEAFARASVDVAVLEVGMGGRLDATNVIDADVAIVTSVGLDHREWLGPDRDAIGAEKAGIARADRPLIVGDRAPPEGLINAAEDKGARTELLGRDFEWMDTGERWRVVAGDVAFDDLPSLAAPVGFHVDNASVAIAALERAGERVAIEAVREGLQRFHIPGRFEVWADGDVEVILDVGHNPSAAERLAQALSRRTVRGRLRVVVAMYRDKDIDGVAGALSGIVACCYPAGMAEARGAQAREVSEACERAGMTCAPPSADPQAALARARAHASPGDCIVVLGSFATVAAARRALAGTG